MTFTSVPFDEDKFYEAVREGVENAIYRALTEGLRSTSTGTDLIYEAIREGTRQAMDRD